MCGLPHPVRAERIEAPSFSSAKEERPFDKLRANGAGKAVVLPLILIARFWQLGPSRLLPPNCRFAPSCSAYAIEAWTRYGALKGSWLAARRLARCHPWGGCGDDPVP